MRFSLEKTCAAFQVGEIVSFSVISFFTGVSSWSEIAVKEAISNSNCSAKYGALDQ